MTTARHLLVLVLRSLVVLALVSGPADGQGSRQSSPGGSRPRAREAGVIVGVLPPGPLNAITDVSGVMVGHTTVVRGDNIRTGVTAILPHSGNLFREKVPGAVFVWNAFGKLAGSTQVQELGEIETPILLTSTLNVPRVADALIDYMLALPGNEDVHSINPLVGETNDGWLNDNRLRPVTREDVFNAIKSAKAGPVEEGAVGSGTGTVAFGWKGGIGTASRQIPLHWGATTGYTVGVLVQTNFSGVLTINGAPVRQELGPPPERGGSCMMVIATDAPLDARDLRRLAARAILGLARTGGGAGNESGDYVIAFSTAAELRIRPEVGTSRARLIPDGDIDPLFRAAIEATEEAIYNSMFKATTTTSRGRTIEALPLEKTLQILRDHKLLKTTGP